MKNQQNIIRQFIAKVLYPLGLFTMFMAGTAAQAAELSVTPMLIELNQKPNSKADFSFSLRSTEKTSVKLRIFDMTQQTTGYMGFNEIPAAEKRQNSSRIDLEKTSLSLPKGRPLEVRGQVKLASKARGTQLFAVMVEEVKPAKNGGGISINIRYAVVIKVNVKGRRHRDAGKFGDLTLIQKKDGTLLLAGMLTNNSPQDYDVKSFVQIRGLDNKLIETVELRSKAAWQKEEKHSRIFPGASVQLHGEIRKIREPGIYKTRVLNRLGKRGQIVRKQELRIDPEQLRGILIQASFKDAAVQIMPNPVPARFRRDNSTFSVFTLKNPSRQTITVKLPEQSPDSISSGGGKFSFIPLQLQLLPGKKKNVVLRQQFTKRPDSREQVFRAIVTPAGSAGQPMDIRVVLDSGGRKNGGQ